MGSEAQAANTGYVVELAAAAKLSVAAVYEHTEIGEREYTKLPTGSHPLTCPTSRQPEEAVQAHI